MATNKNTFRESRRTFIRNSGIVSIGFLGLHNFTLCATREQGRPDIYSRYGPLLKDPEGIMNLPKGFSYKIISRRGEKMADGFLSPGRNDAMATFRGRRGKVIIIRNHEITSDDVGNGPFGPEHELLQKIDRDMIYDYGFGKTPSLGGTTTMIYDERSRKMEMQYLSLAGTIRNCAGGPTPWGSWLTCEETYESKTEGKNEQDHGYVFEVPASDKIKLAKPEALKAMGRFNHEAVAVDPETGIVYQTEDRHDGLIYRFIPRKRGKLNAGGKLQALAVKGRKSFDTRNWEATTIEAGKPLDTEWIDLENVDSPVDDLHIRGFEQGAARFARGEGMWYGNKEIYFA
ncbi:MAG TPA: alkaline phosphatase PhoX, partial [Anseongella sp.]|nr:alkaline phosphatase PhoX [Anseongella sp.]